MASLDPTSFPLVDLSAISNLQNAWVALMLRIPPDQGDCAAALDSVFSAPDLLAALGPLSCIVALEATDVLTDSLLASMPPGRVGFAIAASALQNAACSERLAALADAG